MQGRQGSCKRWLTCCARPAYIRHSHQSLGDNLATKDCPSLVGPPQAAALCNKCLLVNFWHGEAQRNLVSIHGEQRETGNTHAQHRQLEASIVILLTGQMKPAPPHGSPGLPLPFAVLLAGQPCWQTLPGTSTSPAKSGLANSGDRRQKKQARGRGFQVDFGGKAGKPV